MAKRAFSADEGCSLVPAQPSKTIRENGHYVAGPTQGQDWSAWLGELEEYRQALRHGLGNQGDQHIALRFDGIRAWVRTSADWAFTADLQPGDHIRLQGEVRWKEGGNRLCAALDWMDRCGEEKAPWRGWSGVVASAEFPKDGRWHEFRIQLKVPSFASASRWARPILGMDGTFDATQATVELRQLKLVVPATKPRSERWATLETSHTRPAALDDSIYRRPDLAWMARNFVCGFVFIYDRSFWDPQSRKYQVESLCEEARRELGGYDSVVLWQAYPRIGADDRNQFDFFRDMPGGTRGVREAVDRFHRQGVKVFLPYNPWDIGTRRPAKSDEQSLAALIAEIDADGVFLDTMVAAPAGLRPSVDATGPGVAFEPEGHPSLDQIEHCSGSWAQWLTPFPEIGVLRLKWIEPRHMQHQIRRWDHSHQDELAAAWLNGSGILVWENIFGSWNPWNAADRATLRRMAPVLRRFADHFTKGQWLPFYPTLLDRVHASCWQHQGTRLWTLVNRSGSTGRKAVCEVDDCSDVFFDLWRGTPITPERAGSRLRLAIDLDRYGAVAALPRQRQGDLADLVAHQQTAEKGISPINAKSDTNQKSDTVPSRKLDLSPFSSPRCPAGRPETTAGMLQVDGGAQSLRVRHMRRECGCYPDPDCPANQEWDRFLSGSPHDGTIEHHITTSLVPYWIDPKPVTNRQFEGFLKATGYSPKCRDRFLNHWDGAGCPEHLKDQPVVYVDLDDARAYAAWAGKRLPTEWEWQQAAQRHGERFCHGDVHEWTESQRDDGHTRFVMLRGGCKYRAEGSIWYFPGGPQPIESHAKFLLLDSGLDRCGTIGFRCVSPKETMDGQ